MGMTGFVNPSLAFCVTQRQALGIKHYGRDYKSRPALRLWFKKFRWFSGVEASLFASPPLLRSGKGSRLLKRGRVCNPATNVLCEATVSDMAQNVFGRDDKSRPNLLLKV